MKFTVKFFLLLTIFAFAGLTAQQVVLQSARTNEPLSKVQIFNEAGKLLATSDIEGVIEKSDLEPAQNTYVLIYDGYKIASLNFTDFSKDIIKLNDRVREIEEVTIKTSNKAKYIVVRGHFNVYMTVNKELNVYADGIASYTFDNSTKKLRNAQVEQYRAFSIDQENADLKKTNTIAYQAFLKLPELENISKFEDPKSSKKNYKEFHSEETTKIQFEGQALEDKAINLFGYRFYDFRYKRVVAFLKESLNLRDLKEFDEQLFFKFKHKSEPAFHQMIKYANFVPVEISFAGEPVSGKLKLNPEKSSYSYEFWKAQGFPNMQPVFADFFKDKMIEQPNTLKKEVIGFL